jgi:transcriptional regulator with XRE-family HTH domain
MSKLKILREVNNYTQEFIAEALGVDQSTYSKLEKNPKNLKADQAEKLAKLYDVDVADILSAEVTISFSHSTFSDRGYVHNNFEQKAVIETIVATKDDEIKTLKEQVEHLKKQNDHLLRILEGKK